MNEISVEETNEIRRKLGLPPLREPEKHPATILDSKGSSNVNKRKPAQLDEQPMVKKKIKTLGQGKLQDAQDFIQNFNPVAKKKPVPLKKAASSTYTEQDLSGIQVAHNVDDLKHETILVLKDTNVLDDTEDALENQNIADLEHARKNIEIRKGQKAYNAYEAYERQEMGLEKKLLTQYDDMEGPTGFVLQSGVKSVANIKDEPKILQGTISLDYEKTQADDFYTNEEFLEFRKPKKSKKKFKKIKYEDEEVIYEAGSMSNRKNVDSLNFVDDDDLQIALAKIRKKENLRTWTNPKDLAQRIKDQKE